MFTVDGGFCPEFGCYRLHRHIGSGGVGLVFHATDTRRDLDVALKVPRPTIQQQQRGRHLFLREARNNARLPRHDNLCFTYDYGEIDGWPFLAMEHLPHGPLRPTRRDHPPDALRLVRTLALAMQAAHDRAVFHRDLKPANILFGANDRPVIADFGLAVCANDPNLPALERHLIGSLGHISPEQVQPWREELGPGSDIFALGILLYELLTGVPPFPRPNWREYLLSVRDPAPPPPPSHHRPTLAGAIDRVCLRALAHDLRHRHVSMTAFAEELFQTLQECEQESPSQEHPLRPRIDRSRCRFLFTPHNTSPPHFSRPQDTLFLDVGGELRPGVIDHHQLMLPVSTCHLILLHPHWLDQSVNPDRREESDFTFVLHQEPDLDSVASAFLAREYLATATFPANGADLTAYVDSIDRGEPEVGADNVFTLGAAYWHLLTRLTHQPFPTEHDRWHRCVVDGLCLIAFVMEQAGKKQQAVNEVDAFACPGVMLVEDRQSFLADRQRYARKLGLSATHACTADLLLPCRKGGKKRVPALFVRDVQNPGDPDGCSFFTDWAYSDKENCSDSRGFVAVCLFMTETDRSKRRGVLSVRPESEVCLRGLGELLDRAEAAARIDRFRLDDRVQDPTSLEPKRPRPGYPNADPWYDGRAHSYTIVDAPTGGTFLTAEAIERLFLSYGQAEKASPLFPETIEEKRKQ